MGTRILDGEGSVRGTLSGGGVVKRTAAPGEGASNGGEVLLRFFDESESVSEETAGGAGVWLVLGADSPQS